MPDDPKILEVRTITGDYIEVPARICEKCVGRGFRLTRDRIARELFALQDGKPTVRTVDCKIMKPCGVCHGTGLIARPSRFRLPFIIE